MAPVPLLLVACSSAPIPSSDGGVIQQQAEATIAACGVPILDEPPSLTDCEAACYVAARCIEITSRLQRPQSGEVDAGKVYENLDICLGACAQ